MMEVNAYNSVNSSERILGNQNSEKKDDDNGLGINDFMNLLVAQLSNQDVMNPEQDTEFIAQMAQFTSLKAMQSIADLTQTQYSASLVGKKVIVATFDKRGNYSEDTGYVERAKFVDGRSVFTVNGEDYDISSVMEVIADSESTDTGNIDNNADAEK